MINVKDGYTIIFLYFYFYYIACVDLALSTMCLLAIY